MPVPPGRGLGRGPGPDPGPGPGPGPGPNIFVSVNYSHFIVQTDLHRYKIMRKKNRKKLYICLEIFKFIKIYQFVVANMISIYLSIL